MRSTLTIIAVGVAALAASGCGAAFINIDKASSLIEGAVETQVGADVKSVVCPDKVRLKARATFTCAVTGSDGTKGVATLTQTNGKGRIAVSAPFVRTRAAEQSIQADLRRRAPDAVVHCPEIVVAAKGATFACKATVAGAPELVFAKQTDAAGHLTYREG